MAPHYRKYLELVMENNTEKINCDVGVIKELVRLSDSLYWGEVANKEVAVNTLKREM